MQKTEDWKILSDSELVQRARRITLMGLFILAVVIGGLGYLFASAPTVQETGGPARPVRIPVAGEKPSDKPATPAGQSSSTAQLPPNPWSGNKSTPPKTPAPARPASNQVYDL